MPKGALLHSHLDAMVNASFLLNLALEQRAIHIRIPTALTAGNLKSTLPEFRPLPETEFSRALSLSADYIPDSWINIKTARENFDPGLGGPKGFDEWAIGAMMINPTEAYKTHNSVKKVMCSSTRRMNQTHTSFRFGRSLRARLLLLRFVFVFNFRSSLWIDNRNL